MIPVFNKNGGSQSNGGKSAQTYLLGTEKKPREFARLLKGEPQITNEVIAGISREKIYTSGTLAFDYGEGDKLNEQDKLDIIESFEDTMFPNLRHDQYSGYWVEHLDKTNDDGQRRLELNFIFAQTELETGKQLQVYLHSHDKHLVNAWRDVINYEYDLADPEAEHRKNNINGGKNLPRNIKDIRSDLHEIILLEIVEGTINNRDDIVKKFEDIGLEIARTTDKSISIKNPDGKRNIRFKGEIYEREFQRSKYLKNSRTRESEPDSQRTISINEARSRLARNKEQRYERFSKVLGKHKSFNDPRTQALPTISNDTDIFNSCNVRTSDSRHCEQSSDITHNERLATVHRISACNDINSDSELFNSHLDKSEPNHKSKQIDEIEEELPRPVEPVDAMRLLDEMILNNKEKEALQKAIKTQPIPAPTSTHRFRP